MQCGESSPTAYQGCIYPTNKDCHIYSSGTNTSGLLLHLTNATKHDSIRCSSNPSISIFDRTCSTGMPICSSLKYLRYTGWSFHRTWEVDDGRGGGFVGKGGIWDGVATGLEVEVREGEGNESSISPFPWSFSRN